ncbi:porin [Pararhodonellum marinum]|uniref:porin n=1 Tax=Pararhodonellum marinum TaxID=2755358 RepID=UPI00188EF62E|nr:porin [Pararhodonellum marinum]
MKRLTLLGLLLLCLNSSYGQVNYAQYDSAIMNAQPVLNLDKYKFLKDINMIANTRFGFYSDFENGDLTNGRFAMPELRMEVMGKVSERVHFRIRDVYAGRATEPNSQDRLRHSLDIVQIQYDVSPTFSIAGGKMLPEWGAFEFELNPIYLHAFNHLIEYGDHFQTGIVGKWQVETNHLLSFQVVNSRSRSFEEVYGFVPGVERAKIPLGATVNWRGNLFEGKYNTAWSYSAYTEAANKRMLLLQLGNELRLNNFTLQYDYKLSNDQIDRLGQVSNLISEQLGFRALDVRYVEHWMRGEYFLTPRLAATLIGMVSSDYWFDDNLPGIDVPKDDHLRTSWSFTAALEYHVFPSQKHKIFLAYVGRYFRHSDYAIRQFDLADANTGQLSVGLITPLVFF